MIMHVAIAMGAKKYRPHFKLFVQVDFIRRMIESRVIVKTRPTELEGMDEPDASQADMDASFEFIRRVNHLAGGFWAFKQAIRVALRGRGHSSEPLEILDVGTGCADLPIAIVSWALRHNIPIRVTAIDPHAGSIAAANECLSAYGVNAHFIQLAQCGLDDVAQHWRKRTWDVVHAAMMLHHFPDERVPAALATMGRASSGLVVWNDLWRTRMSAAIVHALTMFSSEFVRHDARLSVAKGFSRREILHHVSRAGLHTDALSMNPFTARFLLLATPVH
jgi:2-polyprenyl-3-methyl-5-hydroxy-6-metoxy-1,4-benzoquinol methylase